MKALLITEYIAPVGCIASIRWSKIVKYLVEDYGYEFDLLTNKKRFEKRFPLAQVYRYDVTLEGDVRHFRRIIEVTDSATTVFWYAVRALGHIVLGCSRRISAEKKHESEAGHLGRAPSTSRVRRISRNVKARIDESRFRSMKRHRVNWADYDVVISTYGPSWTHKTAKEGKLANPKLAWIADYRDAPCYSPETATVDNYGFARKFTSAADCVIAVSRGCMDNLSLPEGQRREVVTNGFDEESAKGFVRVQDEKFILAYTGTIYNAQGAARDLSPLFEALDCLVRSHLIAADDVVVEYAGPSERVFQMFASGHPGVSAVSFGQVSREEALRMQGRASLLVLSTWNTSLSQGIITGKVFEYLASRVPIVGLVSGDVPGSDTKEMLSRSGAGFCYEEANAEVDLDGLKKYILEKYRQWKEEGLTSYEADDVYIGGFSHKKLAAQVNRLIEECVAERGQNGCGQ